MFTSLLFIFLLSFFSLFIFRKIAKWIGLVDKPNERKHHEGQVPLIGGISVFFSFMVTLFIYSPFSSTLILYSICSMVLIVLGALDDRFDLSFKTRLFVQAAISLVMIIFGEKSLHNLGYLMGSEVISLPLSVSYIVTIFAVIGAINAFNMVDGIDGLLGGISSVTFAGLGYLFYLSGNTLMVTYCLMLVCAMLPYIMLNLGIPFGKRFKVFMGDAGSMFIGFTVIWLLIEASQVPKDIAIRPVTALWLIALPLMDMVCIMIRRIKKGQSPFKPDREHLHHICQRLGLSPSLSLVLICLAAALMAIIGIWSDFYDIDETVMFVAFLIMFAIYYLSITYVWRLTTFLHKLLKFTSHI